MAPWIYEWRLYEMCAGVSERGAEDGWWGTDLELENVAMDHVAYMGGVDIMKCVDQILRDLVYGMAEKLECRLKFLTPTRGFKNVYKLITRYAEALARHTKGGLASLKDAHSSCVSSHCS